MPGAELQPGYTSEGVTYVFLVLFLESFEGVGAEDAVANDHGDEHDMDEETGKELPRVVYDGCAPVRPFLLHLFHHHGFASPSGGYSAKILTGTGTENDE